MRSWKFPKMFNSNNSNIWKAEEYKEATTQNTILTLSCEQGELLGDPAFGTVLEKYLFEQNSVKLQDVIIDTVYKSIALFMPQLWVRRSDINISRDKRHGKLYCYFTATSQIDFKINTYQLLLFSKSND